MSAEYEWLAVEVVLALPERMIADFGGLGGVRDRGLLESALARPRHLVHYGQPDLFELAAAYAAGISQNHPFHDGNKRTAFMAAYTFLGSNGRELHGEEAQVVLMTIGLASGDVTELDYAAWLRNSCK